MARSRSQLSLTAPCSGGGRGANCADRRFGRCAIDRHRRQHRTMTPSREDAPRSRLSADRGAGGTAAALRGRNANERTGFWNGRLHQGRGLAPRIHGSRRCARRLEPRDLDHAGEAAERPRTRPPKKGGVLRLGLAGGSTTDSVDITSYNDSVMIDVAHGLFNGLVEWGAGRQAEAGARRELRAEERRQGLDLQSAQGDQVLERPGIHRRRRDLLAQPPSGRHQVRRRRLVEAGHRHQEARQVPDPDFARRAGRRPALRR